MSGYVGIPTSYTPVEYIESSGTQYIDTGYSANSNTKLELKLQFASASHQEFIFCGRDFNNGSTINAFSLFRNTSNQFRVDYSSVGTLFSHTVTANNDYTYVMDKNKLYENNVLIRTETSASFSATNKLRLFSAFNPDSTINNFFEGKVFYCKIWNNDTLVRDFIPALDENNVACLYDQVEGKFYYNQGTGTFTAGATSTPVSIGDRARKITKAYVGVPASYTPVEYLESSGTQFIDTKIKTNEITRVEAVASNTFGLDYQGISYGNSLFGARVGASDSNFQYANGAYNEFFGNGTAQVSITRNTSTNILTITYSKTNYNITSTNYNVNGSLSVTITTPLDIYIFGLNNNGTNAGGTWKLYSLKMYDSSNNLVRDFIPTIDQSNVACLYDLVEGKLYYNEGTGNFTAGSTTGQPVSIGSRARKITKAYVGVQKSYTPVEYIESSGTQYIDTGFKMSNTTKIETKLSMTADNIMTAVGVGGSYQSFSIQTYNGNYRVRWRSGSTSNIQVDSAIPAVLTTPHVIEANSTNAKIDGTVIGNTNSYTFTETSNLFIFAMSSNNTAINNAIGRIYYYKIYNGSTLVRDFIPAVDQDNVACLYDLVEGKFYYKQGSGTFTAGSATGQPVTLGSVARLCFGSSKPNYTMLYAYGDNAESGGFFYTRIRKTGDNKENAFSTTNYQINATNIYVYGSQPSASFNSYGGMITNNSFDMTGYTRVYAKTAKVSTTGNGTEIYIPTFQGTTYDLGNNATSSVSFKVNGNGGVEVNKPNNVFSISKTDTRRLGLGISSLGWRGNVAAYLYVLAMFKADNVTPLANILGVSADINSILAVSSQLLSNETACVCMIGTCTGDFMISALNDSTFRTNLNSSAYKNLILSNEHWNKFYGYLTT